MLYSKDEIDNAVESGDLQKLCNMIKSVVELNDNLYLFMMRVLFVHYDIAERNGQDKMFRMLLEQNKKEK